MKSFFFLVVSIAVLWIALSVWVEYFGAEKGQMVGKAGPRSALLVYNPDPIYNLDQQICLSFAQGLSKYGFQSKISLQACLRANCRATIFMYSVRIPTTGLPTGKRPG